MAAPGRCRRFGPLPAVLLLVVVLSAAPGAASANIAEEKPHDSLGRDIDDLRDKATAQEREAKEEADAEHYEEAVQLLRLVKETLEERAGLLRERGRAATSAESLERFSKALEENTKWLKKNKELLNLLKLAL